MRIEIFEIMSIEDIVYQELLEQYKTNPELRALLNELYIDSDMILAGDFRFITMMDRAIGIDNIKVYLVKDVDDGLFLWVIGKFMDEEGKIIMHPLLKEQSEYLQLEIKSALVEKGLIKK